jgi:Ca-activated chloride channel homolog
MRSYSASIFVRAAAMLSALLTLVSSMMAGGLVGWGAPPTMIFDSDSITVSTVIREQVAVTTTEQWFTMPDASDSSAASYGFTLPAGATVTSFRWEVDGTWYKATLRSADTATQTGGGGPSLATFARNFGSTPFVFSFSHKLVGKQSVRTELTYVEVVQYGNDKYVYSYPFRPNTQRRSPLKEWNIDLRSGHEILASSITPAVAQPVVRDPDHHVYAIKDVSVVETELRVSYSIRYDGLTLNVLSCKPEGEDGYALMTAVPQSSVNSGEVLNKRFIFVIDRSGSMGSERKLQHARDAALYCVGRLNSNDLFNVIAFDHGLYPWKEEPAIASAVNVAQAKTFLNQITVGGGTEIMMALNRGLQGMVNDDFVNVIIFLTDGQAPIDHGRLAQWNTTSTRIYVFGVGTGVNEGDLRRIAKDHNGTSAFVVNAADVVPAISGLWERIRDPLIKNPVIDFAPAVVYDVYPPVVEDIYAGEQLQLVGRYTAPGDVTVNVNGTDANGPVHYAFAGHLTDDPTVNTFVPKIWARYRIDMLLEWMQGVSKTSGQWKEWRNEIIRLGMQYGIVTPFTSFVDEGQVDEGDSDSGSGGGNATSVEDERSATASLCSISPNPVSGRARISIDLSLYFGQHITVRIIDIEGRTVAELHDGDVQTHLLILDWEATDASGQPLTNGSYFVAVSVGGVQFMTRFVVVR